MASSSSLNDLQAPGETHEDDTWDSTFEGDEPGKSPVGSATLCPHAVASGCHVYGIAHQKDESGRWWTWKRSLEYQVNAVSSNVDGSVVVASTTNGTVSLIRGSDGQVLATRKVMGDDAARLGVACTLSWITGASATSDSLLIEVPAGEEGRSNVILVSNIQGALLNHDNKSTVAEAARNMKIQALRLAKDLRTVSGCFLDQETIRLVGCDSEGNLAVFDHDMKEKGTTTLVKSEIGLGGDIDWSIDFDVGLKIQTVGKSTFFLCSAFSEKASAVFWFDPVSLQAHCHFELASEGSRRPKVLGLEPLQSLSNIDALSVVIAQKISTGDSSGSLLVLQILIEDTLGLILLSKPHVVYTIPTEKATLSVAMAAFSSEQLTPYSFRYKLWRSVDDCVYKEFLPNPESSRVIGNIRQLLAQGEFDRADEILVSASREYITLDSYARFHSSEIAWDRLRFLLGQGRVEAVRLEQIRECLRRLAASAVIGNNFGVHYLLEAITEVTQCSSFGNLKDFRECLGEIATTLKSVAKTLPSEEANKLEPKRQAVENQIAVLTFLFTLLEGNANSFDLTQNSHALRSPRHLYAFLVKQRKFAAAEDLCRSQLKTSLTAEALILPIVKISRDVNPKEYVPLLTEIVLPRLEIGHELLPLLRSWACRIADELDDDDEGCQFDLSAALLLLEGVEKATRNLQLQIHASFGYSSPFVERLEIRKSRKSPRSSSSSHHTDISSSSDSSSSLGFCPPVQNGGGQFRKNPIPTILELGGLKGGATKSTVGSLDLNDDAGGAYDGKEGCVAKKLREAKCLREARLRGLSRKVVQLRDFERKGGALFVAKELVRLFSSSAKDHETRSEFLSENVNPFCEAFEVAADSALFEYTLELCRSKTISEQVISESSSVARCCSSIIVKCRAALAVLRAALLCDVSHVGLATLSKDAITWAVCDSALQSELEEASRLLQVDYIILKYCGAGARELFRVDNARHAVRLLGFVTKHVREESVIEDALSLCDAFHHLTPQEAARSILCRAILEPDPGLSVSLFEKLIANDIRIAERCLIDTAAFCEELLRESSKVGESSSSFSRLEYYRNRARLASSNIGALIVCALEKFMTASPDITCELDCFLQSGSLEPLRECFSRIERLQRNHSVFVSLSDLSSMKIVCATVSPFVREVAECHLTGEVGLLNRKVAIAKRVCALLTSNESTARDVLASASYYVAEALIRERQDDKILDFLFSIGVLTEQQSEHAGSVHLSVVLSLCLEASNDIGNQSCLDGMRRVGRAASLLKDWSLTFSCKKLLPVIGSLACNLDFVCQVFGRSDEGVGDGLDNYCQQLLSSAWSRMSSGSHQPRPAGDLSANVRRPILHSSWYIGDGILLPPGEVFCHGLSYLKEVTRADWTSDDGLGLELHQLAEGKGAHSLALRAVCSSIAQRACGRGVSARNVWCDGLRDAFGETVKSLAERSLGGTGSGITNAIIDGQLAVSSLLSMPMKLAFDSYSSCLPTAVKTQNFERVFRLANIGLVAGSGDTRLGSEGIFAVGWKRQKKLFDQCRHMITRANFGSFLREHSVTFNCQQLFDGGGESGHRESTYVASLVAPLIAGLSRTLKVTDVFQLVANYAGRFGLSRDFVLERHVEFFLSPPTGNSIVSVRNEPIDVRHDLNQCEKTVRASLHLLQTPVDRVRVLRRCLINLDNSTVTEQDYERYSLVLTLYQESLTSLLEQDLTIRNIDPAPFELELEAADRRRDALAVLSSYFQGDRVSVRPLFSKFFPPLTASVTQEGMSSGISRCGILGPLPKYRDPTVFDPLQGLEDVFLALHDMATVTALAPLCIPLGVPQGYIHARSLIARFLNSSAKQSAPPSFDNDVIPIFGRIESPSDKAVLAEWCATQYDGKDEEKLKCLELVLRFAMEASSEIENRRALDPDDKALEELEMQTLEILKRTSCVKDALSDKLRVKSILLSATGQNHGAFHRVVEDLVSKLDEKAKESPRMPPETLIEFLFEKGSLLCSEASLDKKTAFSMNQFRQFCSAVHAACNAVAEEHSHIHTGRQAKRFVQKLLFYGDQAAYPEAHIETLADQVTSATEALSGIDEEDTADFVMDLSEMHRSADSWDVAIEIKSPLGIETDLRFTSREETSSLTASSSREISEAASQRAALRIAFVMASTDGPSSFVADCEKENKGVNVQNRPAQRQLGGLLAKIDTKKDSNHDNKVLSCARELLRVVFARSGVSSNLFTRTNSFEKDETLSSDKQETPKTITFAMRHRALRAASVLCPQEALERVARSEGFLRSQGSELDCSLNRCAFGIFVAKEIEEMGLPLPHSDLVQLSSMHFSTYARTLWKHHRDHDSQRSKGRLLLLLVEMSLQDERSDAPLVDSLLQEMMRLNLSRSLLLTLERIAASRDRAGSINSVVGDTVCSALAAAGRAVLSEVQHIVNQTTGLLEETSSRSMVETVERLFHVLDTLCTPGQKSQQMADFSCFLLESCCTKQTSITQELSTIAARAHRRQTSPNLSDTSLDPEKQVSNVNQADSQFDNSEP